MGEKQWQAVVLLPNRADASGTQTVWIDEEHAGKNQIKSGDYVFITSNSRIGTKLQFNIKYLFNLIFVTIDARFNKLYIRQHAI